MTPQLTIQLNRSGLGEHNVPIQICFPCFGGLQKQISPLLGMAFPDKFYHLLGYANQKKLCQSVEQAENHKKGPRWSWAGNYMGNVNQYE
jgi:hypothetical protein